MGERRRPVGHFRRTASGLVEVNKGVFYSDPRVRGGDTGPLAAGIRQLETFDGVVAPPPPEHTGVMLTAGDFDINAYNRDAPDGWTARHYGGVDPATGEGQIRVHLMHPTDENIYHDELITVKPGMRSLRWNTNLDLRRAHIPGATFHGDVTNCSFAEAHMDGATIGEKNRPYPSRLFDVSFEGASLRDATFSHLSMSDVSFVGVDAAGARFENVTYPDNVDITDSNIHPNQFYFTGDDDNFIASFIYRQYTLDEVVEVLGEDPDGLVVEIWSGDLEVRDNTDGRLVEGGFDKDRHHIPQWEVQRLAAQRSA